MSLNKVTKPKKEISCIPFLNFLSHRQSHHNYNYYFITNQPIGLVVECSPMGRKTGVQSQVESYQRLKKWYLIPPGLTLSIIRYVSRVKWSNLGKGVAPSPTLRCNSYWKGNFQVALDYHHQLNLLIFHLQKTALLVQILFLYKESFWY